MKSILTAAMILLIACNSFCQYTPAEKPKTTDDLASDYFPKVQIVKSPTTGSFVSSPTDKKYTPDQVDSVLKSWAALNQSGELDFTITNKFGSGARFKGDTLHLTLGPDVKMIHIGNVYYQVVNGEVKNMIVYSPPVMTGKVTAGTSGNITSPPATKSKPIKKP